MDKRAEDHENTLDYKSLKVSNTVKIAWALLIVVMVALYIFFN
jgi:hypothetical protein